MPCWKVRLKWSKSRSGFTSYHIANNEEEIRKRYVTLNRRSRPEIAWIKIDNKREERDYWKAAWQRALEGYPCHHSMGLPYAGLAHALGVEKRLYPGRYGVGQFCYNRWQRGSAPKDPAMAASY